VKGNPLLFSLLAGNYRGEGSRWTGHAESDAANFFFAVRASQKWPASPAHLRSESIPSDSILGQHSGTMPFANDRPAVDRIVWAVQIRKRQKHLMTEILAIAVVPIVDAWLMLCWRWRHAFVLLIACTALPTSAIAQAGDAAYCTQLGDLALHYTGGAGSNGGLRPDLTTLGAIEDCKKGNTAAGIPVLEKTLRNNGFTLPKR
jgi:hypothetical protein